MAFSIHIDHHSLTISASGVDAMLSLRRRVEVPLEAITAAQVMSQSEAKKGLGWRVGGGYWSGWFATGWFTVPGRKGSRQWWLVYRDPEVLVIDTSLQRPARIVVQTDERHAIAEQLQRRLNVL